MIDAPQPPTETGFLGPAEVLERSGDRVRVRLDDGEGTEVEAGLALALVVVLYRRRGTLDTEAWKFLRG